MNFQFLLYFFNNSLSKDRQRNMLRETITIVREDLLELQLSQIAGNENLQEISIVQNYKGSKRCRSPQGLVLNDELPWKKEKMQQCRVQKCAVQ